MNKFIVTTTISKPSEALITFSKMKDWHLIVVGDLKTPHEMYRKLNLTYLDPQYQITNYYSLSSVIGWNSIQRRNIGFIEAYKMGADIVATIDDDNIPYNNWGRDIRVGQEIEVDFCSSTNNVFDPLMASSNDNLWHRGYPIDLVSSRTLYTEGKNKLKVLFQADLWDGDPDIDAICRFIYDPTNINIGMYMPVSTKQYAPFNSQNTFIAKEALPYYMVFPHIGRMDDIWGGYIAQYLLNTRPLFMPATVYQKRNYHDIKKDFEKEIIGYTQTVNLLLELINNPIDANWRRFLPEDTQLAFDLYRKEFK